MDNHAFMNVESPVGRLTIVANRQAVVAVCLPGSPDDLPPGAKQDETHPILARAAAEIGRYFKGSLKAFTVPVSFDGGTEFQRAVWTALASIPYGETRSYSWVAREIGRPTSVRAVGRACGQNPVAIIVPCHRVIGVDGSLTGYAGGMDCKRTLLAHEHRHSAEARP